MHIQANPCKEKDDIIQAISADFWTGIIGGKGAIIIIFWIEGLAFTFVFDIVVHFAKVLEQEVGQQWIDTFLFPSIKPWFNKVLQQGFIVFCSW